MRTSDATSRSRHRAAAGAMCLLAFTLVLAAGPWLVSPAAAESEPGDQAADENQTGKRVSKADRAALNKDNDSILSQAAEKHPPAGDSASDTSSPHGKAVEGNIAFGYHSTLVGSPHDFSDRLGGPADVCKACHVPHVQALRPLATRAGGTEENPAEEAAAAGSEDAANPSVADGVAGDGSDESLQPSFESYRIPGQRKVFQTSSYSPGPSSLVCLGCHDGTVATSTIGSSHAMLAGVRAGFEVPDDFVWRDHPIGIEYPRGDPDYRPRSHVLGESVPLPDGHVECVSCHEPHNRTQLPKMLTKSNSRSALCLTCHVK